VIERRSCPSESRLELSEKASLNGFRRGGDDGDGGGAGGRADGVRQRRQ
jgi:hypothetical protein